MKTNFLSRLMVATRPLDFVLLLSKEDSLVRQKYNFFVLQSDN